MSWSHGRGVDGGHVLYLLLVFLADVVRKVASGGLDADLAGVGSGCDLGARGAAVLMVVGLCLDLDDIVAGVVFGFVAGGDDGLGDVNRDGAAALGAHRSWGNGGGVLNLGPGLLLLLLVMNTTIVDHPLGLVRSKVGLAGTLAALVELAVVVNPLGGVQAGEADGDSELTVGTGDFLKDWGSSLGVLRGRGRGEKVRYHGLSIVVVAASAVCVVHDGLVLLLLLLHHGLVPENSLTADDPWANEVREDDVAAAGTALVEEMVLPLLDEDGASVHDAGACRAHFWGDEGSGGL